MCWCVAPTHLFKMALPRPPKTVRDRLRALEMSSRLLKLSLTWQMPEWELELLWRGNGRRPIADTLRRIPLTVPFPELRKQLFFLYHIGAINLLPPASGGRGRPR